LFLLEETPKQNFYIKLNHLNCYSVKHFTTEIKNLRVQQNKQMKYQNVYIQ